MREKTFQEELTALINKYSLERYSDTPDFILAEFMATCLHVLNRTISEREYWYRPPNNEEAPRCSCTNSFFIVPHVVGTVLNGS